ncbi:MAG: drug/metabolite exporter YedA [Myxococcota bacterium]|nr:drug/metabolite exporter YedA [Myxococcota bacterium]
MRGPGAKSVVREERGRVIAALVAVYFIWGSTYLAMRFAVESLPPLLMAGTRFLIAGGAMYGWLRLRGGAHPTWPQWRSGLFTGVLLLGFGNGAVALAQKLGVSSGLAAVMVASMPLWAALFSGLWGEWPRWRDWLGLGIGASGIALLNLDSNLRGSAVGALLLVLAPVSWALGSVWSRRLPMARGPMGSATQMLSGGVVMLLVGLLFEPLPTAPTARSLGALAYLAVFGSIIGFSAYGYLLRTVRPAVATSYAYVNPVVALALGVLVAGERITPVAMLGAGVVLLGVVIALVGKGQAPKAAPVAPPALVVPSSRKGYL